MPELVKTDVEIFEKRAIDSAAKAGLYFKDYMQYVHKWTPRQHQIPWVEALQDLADGKLLDVNGNPTNKLMILAAPGFGKTDTMIEYNAWMIGRSIERGEIPQVGYVAYADDVAMLRSLAIRNTIEHNDEYKMVFPFVEPDKTNRWAAHEWFLARDDVSKKDPTMRASGITGQILSYRFPTLLTIDDPHDPKNVKTAGQRDEVWRIWRTTIRTRVYEATPIILICTRWAEDDLAGRLLAVEDNWAVVHGPALDEADQSVWPPEKNGMGWSTKVLHTFRAEDKDSFLTQYMALPPAAAGDIFKWWTFGPQPALQEVERVIQSWDTALTAKTYSSYSAMVEGWLLKNGRVYINKVWRGKLEFPALLEKVVEEYWEAEKLYSDRLKVIVENKASGLPIVSMSAIPRNKIKPKDLPRHTRDGAPGQQMDLVARAATASTYFETRHVIIPEAWTSWKEDYVHELKSFPRGRNDDQVSATLLLVEEAYPPRVRNFDYRMKVRYHSWE